MTPVRRFPPVSRVAGGAVRRPPVRDGDVAVVGLGCVLPGAPSVPAFWRNLLEGRSAIGVVPEGRWGRGDYLGADPSRSYTRRAASVDGAFDPLAFRIPPRTAPTLDPSQRLALRAADEAVRSAGWDRAGPDRARSAVILGNAMGGEFAKSMAVRVRFREVLDAVARDELAGGWSAADLRALEARVEERIAPGLPPIDVDSLAGLLSNVVAGRVAAWLDWMGGNLTVDAACASSLASVAVAVDWLRAGRIDAALAGGVDTDLSPEAFVGFCRTEALSRTGAHPFSARADGFVMGEGAAVLALARLADARRRGWPVLAVLRGLGASSDGRSRGITAPRAEGQDLAIERAWREAALGPAEVGLVEAHGTGTAVGDATELEVLARRFADAARPTWLGSVKAQIGHLKGAAGGASLVKAVLALRGGVVPPTLSAGPLPEGSSLRGGALRLPAVAVPLPRPVATVSAFGFGGTNFHLVLEAGDAPDPHPAVTARVAGGAHTGPVGWDESAAPSLWAWGADDPEALAADVAEGRPRTASAAAAAAHRVVALAAAGEDPSERVLRALGGAPDRRVWVGAGPAAPVHLVFPGQGAAADTDDAGTRRFPEALAAFGALRDHVSADLGRAWEALLHDAREGDVVAVHAVGFVVGVAHAAGLAAAGVPVTGVCGHSLGAFPAAVAAGAWSAEALWPAVRARAEALAACPAGALLAVRGDAGPALRSSPGLLPAESRATPTDGELRSLIVGESGSRSDRRPGPGLSLGPGLLPAESRATSTDGELRSLIVGESGSRSDRRPGPGDLHLAAVNGDDQRVYGGSPEAVARAAAALGPARATILSVQRAYHGPPVAPAGRAVAEALAALPAPVTGPIRTLSSRTGDAPADLREDLWRAVSEPVRFDRALAALAGGVVVDVGPGRTLAGLAARAGLPAAALEGAHGPAEVAALLAAAGHPHLADALPATALEPVTPPDLTAPRAIPAPASPTPAAPAERAPIPGSDARAAVVAVIGEVTGYPADWIVEGAELEADLGVDSLRKMEILAALERRFGFTTPESAYGDLGRADLAALVAHVERHAGPGLATATDGERSDGRSAGIRTWVPARPAPPPPGGDADVVRAVGALRERVRRHGAAGLLLRRDPAGVAASAWLASHAREVGAPPLPPGPFHRLEPAPARPLPACPVILATGGASGILPRCLAALADTAPRVVWLHRPGRGPDPAAFPFPVHPVPGDVTDPIDVARAAALARSLGGRLDLVLHAAGSLRDGPWHRATPLDDRAVVGPKWDGARHLAAATADDPLHAFVTFSSLAAHVGSPFQATYAAANAAMETVRHPRARTLHVAFGPWAEVGMAAAPAVTAALQARGVSLLAPDEAAAALRALLGADVDGAVLVAAQALPGEEPAPWPLGPLVARGRAAWAWRLPLDPDAPWLDDHRVGARPLVPAACWVDAMLGAARHALGGDWSADGVEVLLPTFVDALRSDATLVLAGGPEAVTAAVSAGGATVARATLHPLEARPTAPRSGLRPQRDARPLYRPDLLFHGRSWQVLLRWGHDGDRFAADLAPGAGASPIAASIDGIHQVLAAVGADRHGFVALPVGAARWEAAGDGIPVRVEGRVRAQGRELVAEVVATDADGRVVVSGSGVRLRAAREVGRA